MSYSFTKLQKWLECPLAYRFYEAKRPTMEPEIMQAGGLAHLIFEAYALHCIRRQVPTDLTEAPRIAREVYNEARAAYAEERKPYLSEHQFEVLYKDLVEPFLNTHLFDAAKVIDVEQHIAIRQDGTTCNFDDPETWFRGVLDLVESSEDGNLLISDYKTGYSTESDMLQLEVYAWLGLIAWPHVERVYCQFDFVRFNIQPRRTVVSRAEFVDLDQKIRGIIERIEADALGAPCPGLHCQHCQYRGICTAKATPVESVESHEHACKVVEAISLLERDLKAQKELLRAWCTHHGPVAHNGVVWGHHGQGDDGFDDAGEFHAAAAKAGIENPWQYLSVNNEKARKLRRKGEWPVALKALVTNLRSTKFYGKKEKAA